jgi:hypothetical protein
LGALIEEKGCGGPEPNEIGVDTKKIRLQMFNVKGSKRIPV